jgi:hypothetical protein
MRPAGNERGTIHEMRTLAAISTVAALGVAVPAAASGPTSHAIRGGLYGHATMGPLTPVCLSADPCYGPATSARIGFARRGHTTRWTRTDGNGNYRIALPLGRYKIKSKIGFGEVQPSAVKVSVRRYARADLTLDTGIR